MGLQMRVKPYRSEKALRSDNYSDHKEILLSAITTSRKAGFLA